MHTVPLQRRALAILVALILVLLPTSVALANHTANCSEYGFVNRHNGYASERWANHRFGVKAVLDGQLLDLCTNRRAGEGSASTAWVAIQGPPSAYDIVQMGMGRCYFGTGCNPDVMQDGYAWGRTNTSPGCGGYANRLPTATWLGAWSTGGPYSVVEDAAGRFVMSSTKFGVTLTAGAICWTNDIVTIFTESHDYGDALGGNPTNHFSIAQKQFKTSSAGAWMNLPNQCNARQGPGGGALEAVFKCAVNNGNATIELWTER